MRGYFIIETRYGVFGIAPRDGWWHAMWNDEDLGSYHSPDSALDDLVGGHTIWPSSGRDPSRCGLPEDLSEWTFVPY